MITMAISGCFWPYIRAGGNKKAHKPRKNGLFREGREAGGKTEKHRKYKTDGDARLRPLTIERPSDF